MPNFKIDMPNMTDDQERNVKLLYNAFLNQRKMLEYLLNNLDDDNILSVDAAKIKNLEAAQIVTNTIISNSLSSDLGYIAELTVDELSTEDKVKKYIASDTSDVNYIRIYDQFIQFITASTDGTSYSQATKRDGTTLLYWSDETHTVVTEENTGYPVYIYDYTELIKHQIAFIDMEGTYVPVQVFGAGTGVGNNGKGYIYKDSDSFKIMYTSNTGVVSNIQMTDFVDAKHRRLKSCAIDRTAGSVEVLMEGQSAGEESTITMVEGVDTITYTWPDSFTTTVEIS